MTDKRHADGGYDPLWPWKSPTPAAALCIGDLHGGLAYTFEDIRMRCENKMWIAEADNSGRTWTGTSEDYYGAILAMLADRYELHAVITQKPQSEDGDEA